MQPPNLSALGSGDPDSDDDNKKSSRLAARAARFNNVLPGNRYKELEEQRSKERKVLERQGLITSGKTELGDAVDMKGTCQGMCSEYEIEFREYTKEIHPFEATPNRRMDHAKAVAAYTRSDAGAGLGEAAILPSDLRTPAALVRSLDYLINNIMPLTPPPPPNVINPPKPTPRKALGYSAGFIRDRTRAIRKEFAMQSSWGQEEAIASYERIARWHILCLRELQEETGTNTDMHIDSAELGRCFVSLRQQYNDRREELGVDLPCPNEPEFRAYMLIFDLANKSISIPTAELPAVILDHPLVRLAWQIRQAAQRNFDSQKEGSKFNSEFGANLITRFIRLLRQSDCPFLLACLVEIRLREMRRSAIRALTRTYPRLRSEAIRINENGQIVERRMVLIQILDKLLGCEEQEEEEPAWDDVEPVSKRPDDEAVNIVEKFQIEVYRDQTGPVGALINLGAPYNDNRDAPFTRRWSFITAKRHNITYAEIVNGHKGTSIKTDGATYVPPSTSQRSTPPALMPSNPPRITTSSSTAPIVPLSPLFGQKEGQTSSTVAAPKQPAFAFNPTASAFSPRPTPQAINPGSTSSSAPTQSFATPSRSSQPQSQLQPSPSAFTFSSPLQTTPVEPPQPAVTSKPVFSFSPSSTPLPSIRPSQPPLESQQAEAGPSIPKILNNDSSSSAPSPVIPVPSISRPSPPLTPLSSFTPSPTSTLTLLARAAARLRIDRSAFRRILPAVGDQLVNEVVDQLVAQISPDAEKFVRQQIAAQIYATARDRRRNEIERFARLLTDSLLDVHIDLLTREVFVEEIRVKALVVRALKHWRKWTKKKIEKKEGARREREDVFAQLSEMGLGLGRSAIGSFGGNTSEVCDERQKQHVDEVELDVELRQAERSKDELYEPGSFLVATARHVAPILKHQTTTSVLLSENGRCLDPEDRQISESNGNGHHSTWLNVILDARSSGSAVPPDARRWLASKFKPKDEQDIVDEDGIEFLTEVWRGDEDVERNEQDEKAMDQELLASTNTGLVIFEAPLSSVSSTVNRKNAQDAEKRVDFAVQLAKQSRYTVSLFVVTWEDETLNEVINRLDISHRQLELFHAVTILSLHDPDYLSSRFTDALRVAIKDGENLRRFRVTVDLAAVYGVVWPTWGKLVDLVSLSSSTSQSVSGETKIQTSVQARVAIISVQVAVEVLNRLESLIGSTLGQREQEYAPVHIPSFPPSVSSNEASSSSLDMILAGDFDADKSKPVESLSEAMELLVEYFSREPFNEYDEIALELGSLRRTASAIISSSTQQRPNRSLSPFLRFDVSSLVHVLGQITMGMIGSHHLKVNDWEDDPMTANWKARERVDKIREGFEKLVDQAVERVAAASAEAIADAEAAKAVEETKKEAEAREKAQAEAKAVSALVSNEMDVDEDESGSTSTWKQPNNSATSWITPSWKDRRTPWSVQVPTSPSPHAPPKTSTSINWSSATTTEPTRYTPSLLNGYFNDASFGAGGTDGLLNETIVLESPAGTKRVRDESPKEKESKAAKNARLLRALAEVSVTLNQLEKGVAPAPA